MPLSCTCSSPFTFSRPGSSVVKDMKAFLVHDTATFSRQFLESRANPALWRRWETIKYTCNPTLWFLRLSSQIIDHYCVVKGHPDSHLMSATYFCPRFLADTINLRVVSNPWNTLGPLHNAICSALPGVYLGGYQSRIEDTAKYIWRAHHPLAVVEDDL